MTLTKVQEQLVEKNMRFAYKIIHKWENITHWSYRDEIEGEAMIAFIRAAEKYDPNSQYTFTTFAGRCMENEIKNYHQRLQRNKRKSITLCMPISSIVMNKDNAKEMSDAEKFDYLGFSEVQPYEDNKEVIRQLFASLKERDRSIVKQYFYNNVPMADLASEFGISHQAVSQAIRYSCKRMRKRALELGIESLDEVI